MTILDRFSRLTPDLALTLLRFPVPAIVSALICVYANLDAANLVDDGWTADNPVYAAGAAAFFSAGAADYFATGRGWPQWSNTALSAIAAILGAVLLYGVEFVHPMPLYFFAGLVLLLMIAGFLHRGASQAALWFFNLKLGLAALLAIIVGAVFAAGLSAIIESLNFLFEFDLPSRTHEHIWGTALSLIGPIYGLSLAPRSLTEEIDLADGNGTLIERGVSVLVNYVLVPIILVYALILHAYAVKIALDGSLPKGQIGSLVTIFAFGGTAAWIIAWPWRDRGTRLLRWFMAGWFWLTIVPAGLLILATWRRLSDYGVTPDRYGLALVAVWLVIIAAYLAIRRNRADIRLILGSLAILLIVGSVGPWGANGRSISSQFGRLTALLTSNGFFTADAKLANPLPEVSEDARGEALSMLQVLRETGGLKRLRPWFEEAKDDPFASAAGDWDLYTKIATALGVGDMPTRDYISFVANVPLDHALLPGGRLVGPLRVIEWRTPTTPQEDMTAISDGMTLTVRVGDRRWAYPIRNIMDESKRISVGQQKVKPFVVEAASDLSLVFVSVSGEAGEKPRLGSAEIWLILRQ